MGNGYQGEDHHGLKDLTLSAISHVDFHAEPLAQEDVANGQTRFNTFHFDGKVYGSHPSRVTTFRCVKSPKGPDVTVRWDDGSGHTLRCAPGSTAFISTAQLYNLLTDEEKKIADNSYWQPAPHPFAWYGTRKMRSSGLGLTPGGEPVPLDQLPEWSEDKIYKYPMVWLNPVTSEKCLQMMPEIIHKVFFKDSPDANEKVVEDSEEIRLWLNDIYDRIIKPEYVNIPVCKEGDMVVWNNWV